MRFTQAIVVEVVVKVYGVAVNCGVIGGGIADDTVEFVVSVIFGIGTYIESI